jgi:putative lipoic acid-binding regulatory protein
VRRHKFMAENEKDTLLEFPCEFPLKVMGATQDGFAEEIMRVVRQYAPDFDASRMEMRASSGGNYISLTCMVHATSKEQLDNLYRALTGHPMVKVVL